MSEDVVLIVRRLLLDRLLDFFDHRFLFDIRLLCFNLRQVQLSTLLFIDASLLQVLVVDDLQLLLFSLSVEQLSFVQLPLT